MCETNKYQGKFGFFHGEDTKNNVTNFMTSHAIKTPDRKAMMWVSAENKLTAGIKINPALPHESITFAEFNDSTNRICRGLKQIGIKKGDRVIIFLPMSTHLYQTMNAVLKLGAIAVFLDSWARRGHLGSSANTVSPRAMISFEAAYQYCNDVPELSSIPIKIVVGPHTGTYASSYEELVKNEPDETIEPVSGDHTALITFTTGSSGTPKGADRTHQFLAAQHYAIDHVIPYKQGDVDMPAFPIFSLNNIAAGVTTVIPCTDIAQPAPDDPIKLASQILSCGINCATLSISMISGLVEYSKTHDISLDVMERVVTGGAPVSNDLLSGFLKVVPKSDVMLLYGSTEAEPMAHIEAKDILWPKYKKTTTDEMVEEGVNVGFFADDLDAKFVKIHKERIELEADDWTSWEIKDGEVGELLVSGLHVCKRYYNNIEATKDTKVYESNGKVWHRTGDLAYKDEHDQVWLVGRVHNTIIRNGQALFPVKVEILLKRIDWIEKSAFVGIPDKNLGEKAYAVVAPSRELSEAEKKKCVENIQAALNSYNIPVDGILITSDIPMDPRHHSKVEYPILRERIISGDI